MELLQTISLNQSQNRCLNLSQSLNQCPNLSLSLSQNPSQNQYRPYQLTLPNGRFG